MTGDFLNFFKNNGYVSEGAGGELVASPKLEKEIIGLGKTIQENEKYWEGFKKSGNYGAASINMLNKLSDGTLQNLNEYKLVNCSRFFSSPIQEKYPVLSQLDKSILETGAGRGILAKLGGSVSFTDKLNSTSAQINGPVAARVCGKALARVPVLGVALAVYKEIPDIVAAFKNGDGISQLGRSAVNIAFTTVGASVLSIILGAIPVLGNTFGAAAGMYLGGKIGKCVSRCIFGKSVKEKMTDGSLAKETLTGYNTLFLGGIIPDKKHNHKQQIKKGSLLLDKINNDLMSLPW